MSNKYDIFISYAEEDKKVAVALCHFLEDRQFCCWIAPRDVGAGKDWATCIIEGIHSSGLMIVILSEYSNRSHHVRNEVERAFNHYVTILPFRIADVVPEQSLEYFLSSTHWLDALEGSPQNYFDELCANCSAFLRTGQPVDQPKPVVFPKPQPAKPVQPFKEQTDPVIKQTKGRINKVIVRTAIIVFVVLVAIMVIKSINGTKENVIQPVDSTKAVSPDNTANNASVPGLYPQASERLLTSDDLDGKSKLDLKIMRNEIYARHGYVFQTTEMRAYFDAQPWYKPVDKVDTSKFSHIEKANAELIKKFEQ